MNNEGIIVEKELPEAFSVAKHALEQVNLYWLWIAFLSYVVGFVLVGIVLIQNIIFVIQYST